MYRYEGLLVHESHDDDGIMEVIETQGVRSLHFGSSSRQSSMRLSDPDRLELDYVRAMMAWPLFKAKPGKAMVVGLGGGSLTRYLLQHYADIRIKVIEYRQNVVKIARSHFDLPLDPRLKIIVDDGGDYLCKRSEALADQYQLLFLDAFDHDGMAESVRSAAFFDACKNVLSADGIMVINLWGSDKTLFEHVTWHLGKVFNWRLLYLPVSNKGNIIGFAFAENVPTFQMNTLRNLATHLETQHRIEFSAFLREFKRNNAHLLNKVITL